MKSRKNDNKTNLLRARKRLRNSLRKDESFARSGRDLPEEWGRPALRRKLARKDAHGEDMRFSIEVPVPPGSVVRVGDVMENILVRVPDEFATKTVVIELRSDAVLISRSTLPVSEDGEVKAYAVVSRHNEHATNFRLTVRGGGVEDSVDWKLAPDQDNPH